VMLVAAPWHVLATLRNPPFFDFTMRSGPGEYRGFFWFYFINEHVLRFLNLRYPRDYNTVPRLWFWLLQLVWLFPWSSYLPAVARLCYRPTDRAGRTRVLALCWFAVVMVFFTLSTTQEYYSMPMYPALALLLGSAMTQTDPWLRRGTKLLAGIAAAALVITTIILFRVRTLPTPGDISGALRQHPELYTFSLGHVGDLTLAAFAYLQAPLLLAGFAALIGAVGLWVWRGYQPRAYVAAACMMVILFHAARLAMVAFDPYLGSKPLADALVAAPPGKLIEANAYYTFSSVFFYANRRALLWNGRMTNLEYGSYAPGAPKVFIDDADLKRLWSDTERCYLLVEGGGLPRLRDLVGQSALYVVKESGGKYLLTNQHLTASLVVTPARDAP
jgi:hypothetical protein